MSITTTAAELDALTALEVNLEEFDYTPSHAPRPVHEKPWEPDLNPTQKLIWDDPTPFMLLYGEKGSGKTCIAEHKLIRHCYENWDALGLIVTPSIRTGTFGIIQDLETLILPLWEQGIGLEWIRSRLDPSTKDRILKVANRFGGWSTILQISIPFAEAIPGRIKGIAPSMIFIDELTDCGGKSDPALGRDYFTMLVGQLNRRRGVHGPQQYVATCNPRGPSHWVYKTFWEDCFDPVTGVHNPAFKAVHVPFRENSHRPELKGYLEKLEYAVAHDPIQRARLIDGQWVERPTGAALFKDFFNPEKHVIGNAKAGTGLVPVKGLPCCIGYDLGQVFSAAVFMQHVVTASGPVWIVFDEIAHIREKILYKQMAHEVCQRIRDWHETLGCNLTWQHITDDSATTQWRPGSGSYDAFEFEKAYAAFAITHGLGEMKMIGAPKGAGSVEMRVMIVQGLLHADQLLISDTCEHVKACMMQLEAKDGEELKPKKTAAGHIHVHDALSYPLIRASIHGDPARGPCISSITTLR